jgi:hypothetical protein
MVTIVPDYGQFPMDSLNALNSKALWLKTARIFGNEGISLAFGGTDFSVNQDKKAKKPYLQVQFTLFISEKQWPKSDTRLRKALNLSGEIERPVRVETFDGDNAGLAYALKYEFNRRVGYQQTPEDRHDGRKSKNTRNRPLRGPDWMRLMVLLDHIGLDARICLVGVKRILKNGEVVMQLIK